ncbi:COA8 family protein CG14806, mitochondrial isoform X3 [Condylostylus longicornis]|uniref:COA8 family protein CG14806, mitochondrial isoform X3 n=1 Tax=Condylostylus longicornis TaxID=2530218 RepID=UPI00244DB0CC|nr:COA8 family protein CG14806, mitochondrial isoform X3 [Condylostylus longicornis]
MLKYNINFLKTFSRSLAVKSGTNPGLLSKPDSKTILNDYIGPPDKYSNLRPIVRAEKNNETNLEKQLREKQIEVEEWNQEFWSRHNKRFYEIETRIA